MLFSDNFKTNNLLPMDGEVVYYGNIYDRIEADLYFKKLLNDIKWEHDEVKIFGKTIITARKMAWYSIDSKPYSYSNATKHPNTFTDTLLDIKEKVEMISEEKYNSCLLNLYHNGTEGMGWHADNEKEIVPNSAIASLSFGAERFFSFKHRATKETLKFNLQHGSLLVMKGETQSKWLHSLPKSVKIISPRINLTFRKMA